jgi:hypothetical protein
VDANEDNDKNMKNCPTRFAIGYNSIADTGTSYPQSIFSTQYINTSQARLQRARIGSNFAAWVQGIRMCQTCSSCE